MFSKKGVELRKLIEHFKKIERNYLLYRETTRDVIVNYRDTRMAAGGNNPYLKIVNPLTNRKISINSKLGKKIINNYKNSVLNNFD